MPVERRVNDLVRRMRPDEKLGLLSGKPNNRLGIPELRAVTGVMGVSAKDASGQTIPATAFPANIGIAATWNPGLAEQVGAVVAQQARSMGRGQILGPLITVSRSPLGGDLFETYGEDPFLTSRIASGFIEGVQGEGAIATAIYEGGAFDNRTAREIDLRPLESVVTEAGVWAVTPRVKIAADPWPTLLRSQLGFRGFAVSNGSAEGLSAAEIDDQVRGTLRAMFASGVFDRDARVSAEIESAAHRAIARTAAARSIVLLKNEGGLLPVDPGKLRSIVVFGPNAPVNRMGGGNYTVAARYSDPPLAALRAVFGSRLLTGGVSPGEAANVARSADIAVVFAGTGADSEAESRDRSSLHLPAGLDDLIKAVAKANPHTIVVLTNGSPVAMPWIHDVSAVVEAWFPGEEGGHAIADILTGAGNPSGRLPVTFPARIEDLPAHSAGLYSGYRHFDRAGIAPLFPFGFGLSYTRFEYSDMAVLPSQVQPGQFAEVSVTVRNAGSRPGTETVQLYLHAVRSRSAVERPLNELRAFEQVDLKAGESKRVRFTLTPASTSWFDARSQEWVQDQAEFEVRIGSSSRDVRATGSLTITE